MDQKKSWRVFCRGSKQDIDARVCRGCRGMTGEPTCEQRGRWASISTDLSRKFLLGNNENDFKKEIV